MDPLDPLNDRIHLQEARKFRAEEVRRSPVPGKLFSGLCGRSGRSAEDADAEELPLAHLNEALCLPPLA